MKDAKKTKQALITELQRLRHRLERVDPQGPERIQDERPLQDGTGHRWLNRTALDLIALSDPDEILRYAGETLAEHLGDCIVLTLARPADEKALRVETIHGISGDLLTRVLRLFRGRLRGRTFPIVDHCEQVYRERRLHRHEGGLAGFAAEGMPEAAAKALARLVRADHVYTMALVGRQHVLGNLHILGRRPDLITEPEVVETFAYQVALALERATAYDAVTRGRRELEETLESLDEVVLRIDDQFVIQLNNRASAEAMGIPQHSFVGRQCYNLFYGRETVCPRCPAQEAMETRQQASALRHQSDGRILARTVYPVLDDEGRVEGATILATDITERIHAQEALQEAKERLELAMDAGEHGFWDWNLDTDEITFSPRYQTMLGYEPGELPQVKKTWVKLIHPEDRQTVLPQIEEHVARAEPYAVAFRVRCKDGSWKWILGRGKAYELDDEGRPHRAVGVHVDIDAQREMEEALRRRTEEQEMLLDTVATQIWYLSDVETYGAVNAAHAAFFGVDREDLEDRSLFDIVEREEAETCIAGNREVFDQKRQISTEEWVVNGEGKPRSLAITKTPRLTPEGEVDYVVCAARDITARRRAEDLLRIEHDSVAALSSTSDLGTALDELLETLLEIPAVDAGGIYLIDDETGCLQLETHRGLSPGFVESASAFAPDAPQHQLVRSGTPRYATYSDILAQAKDDVRRDEGLRAMAIVPVQNGGDMIAAINVASRTHGSIPEGARESLEAVAAQVGGAIARLKAEAALRQSEKNLQTLFNSLDDFLFIMDADGCILHVNRVIQERLGYPMKALRGKNVLAVHPADRREEAASIVSAMLAGDADTCLVPLVTKAGAEIPVETKVTRGRWGDQEVLFGISRDITARLRAEEALERRLAFEETVTSISTRLVKGVDLDAALEASLADLGATPEADRAYIFLLSDDGQTMDNTHEWCAEGVTPEIDNLQGLPSDTFPWWMTRLRTGETIHVPDVSAMPEEASVERAILEAQEITSILVIPLHVGGKLAGFVGLDNVSEAGEWSASDEALLRTVGSVFGNAIERQRTREALERRTEQLAETEASYRALFEQSRDGLFVTDPRGVCIDANPAAVSLTGYEREMLIGASLAKLTPPEQRTEIANLMRRLPTERGGGGELVVETCEGTRVPVDIVIGAITYHGRPAYLGAMRDITERKRAERELQASEQLKSMILASSPAYICHVDEDYRFVFANDRWAEAFGFDPQDIFGQTCHEVLRGRDEPCPGCTKVGVMEAREPIEGELTWRDRTYYQRSLPMVDADGAFTGVITSGFDITERKLAQDALARSERKFREVFDASPIGIDLYDDRARLIDANQASLDLFGASSLDSVLGFDLFQDPYLPDGARDTLRHGETVRYEAVFDFDAGRDRGYDASTRSGRLCLDVQVTSLGAGDGTSPRGYLVQTRDVTQRRLAEEQIRESKRQLELALHGGALGTWDWRIDTDEVRFDRRWAEMLGYELEEMEPHISTWRELSHPDDLAAAERVLKAHVGGEIPLYEAEIRMRHKSGEWRWVLDRGRVISRDAAGRATRACGTHLDITERKRLREQLLQQEQLSALGQMASGIAHDFRNRLNPIMLYAEMALQGTELPPALSHDIEVILAESRGMADLVQQFLDFSSRAMIHRQPLDLGNLLEDLLKDIRDELPPGVRITLEQEPGPHVASLDEGRIRQALHNLVSNACDAMPHGGDLHVSVSRLAVAKGDTPPIADMEPGTWLRVAVSDTGTGMTDKVEQHVFEPFFTTKDVDQGTGLGLAQTYGIVRQHDGHIGVETEAGQGTTFTLYFPASGGPAPGASGSQAGQTHPEEQTPTILVVEDDALVREALEDMLTALGYRVFTAAGGREALALCQSPRWSGDGAAFDLVITDMTMPEVDGKALVKRLHRSHADLKAVGITAYPVGELGEELRATGFLEIVQKPFGARDLERVLAKVFDEPSPDRPGGTVG